MQLMDQGRQARVAGDSYAALAAVAKARQLQPDDPGIARTLADILADLGAVTAAADALGNATELGLRSRLAGQRLRWAVEVPPRSPDPASRFEDIDPALSRIDALLAQARNATAPDPGMLLRLQRDRAVALRNRERWGDAIGQVDSLRAQGDLPLPLYVLQAEADSRLALRQPVAARRLYDEALARMSPAERAESRKTARELLRGRFFAEVESEDFDAAFATADQIVAAEPDPFRREGALQNPSENVDWLEAQALGAQARSYADMPAEAWKRIEPLARGAPALPWLRAIAADIEAERGWVRRAEVDIEVARALAPDDFGIRLAQVESDIRRHRLARADERLAPLLQSAADMPDVQRVKRDLDAEMGPSVMFDVSGLHQKNDGVLRSPGTGYSAGMRVESGSFDGLWRLVGFGRRVYSSPLDVHISRNLLGGGAVMRWPDTGVEALAWSQTGSNDATGASVAAFHEFDDHWTVKGAGEYHSSDVPVRADYVGVTGNTGRLGASYKWHESAQAEMEFAATRFSDGNNREDLALVSALKVLDQPHLDITLHPRIDWTRNSRAATFYFSPAQAWGAQLAAEVEYVTWRSYETVFVQRAMLTAGAYDQRAFGSRGIGAVLYGHSWRWDPFTELNYGVSWNSRVYDGQREKSWEGYLTFIHRFGR